jgi:hypothetical protein
MEVIHCLSRLLFCPTLLGSHLRTSYVDGTLPEILKAKLHENTAAGPQIHGPAAFYDAGTGLLDITWRMNAKTRRSHPLLFQRKPLHPIDAFLGSTLATGGAGRP